MINLSSYGAVESALFLKWSIPGQSVKYISDYHTNVDISGNTYVNDGTLLGVSAAQDEIKASASQLTIGLSGLKSGAVAEILDNPIKGSAIEVFRGFFDASTHALIDLTPASNPVSKFAGIVTNYALVDGVDSFTNEATTEISLTCNSIVEVLQKKVGGRRTNKYDFADEKSMDRVQVLSRSNFNFGAPTK